MSGRASRVRGDRPPHITPARPARLTGSVLDRLVLWAFITAIATAAHGGELRRTTNATPGRYIVVLKDPASAEARGMAGTARAARTRDIAEELAAPYRCQADWIYASAIQGFAVRCPSDAEIQEMARDPRVRYVETEGLLEAMSRDYDVCRIPGALPPCVPWGLDRLDQRKLPLDNRYTPLGTGRGVNAESWFSLATR